VLIKIVIATFPTNLQLSLAANTIHELDPKFKTKDLENMKLEINYLEVHEKRIFKIVKGFEGKIQNEGRGYCRSENGPQVSYRFLISIF